MIYLVSFYLIIYLYHRYHRYTDKSKCISDIVYGIFNIEHWEGPGKRDPISPGTLVRRRAAVVKRQRHKQYVYNDAPCAETVRAYLAIPCESILNARVLRHAPSDTALQMSPTKSGRAGLESRWTQYRGDQVRTDGDTAVSLRRGRYLELVDVHGAQVTLEARVVGVVVLVEPLRVDCVHHRLARLVDEPAD